MSNKETIKELKEELKKYTKKDEARLKIVSDQQEIARLKKEIREKKYVGVKQVGKNLKTTAKNIGTIGKAIGKGLGKFVGEDPKKRTVEQVIKELPQ